MYHWQLIKNKLHLFEILVVYTFTHLTKKTNNKVLYKLRKKYFYSILNVDRESDFITNYIYYYLIFN